MKRLYPDRKLNLIGLSEETGKNYANLSKLITTLESEDLQLVKTEKVSRKRGRPFRLISLTPRAKRIISTIIMQTRPAQEYDPITIDLCLDIIQDLELDEETRMPYADSLHNLFTELPIRILTQHKRLRETLEKVLQDPPPTGEVEERLRSVIKGSLPRLTKDEKTRTWVLDKVYPNALRILEERDKPEKIVIWAIAVLEAIGTHSPDPLKKGIKTRLLDLYFDDSVEPTNKIAEKLADSILEFDRRSAESSRQLAAILRERAKSANSKEKEKATALLRTIIQYLTSVPSIQVQ